MKNPKDPNRNPTHVLQACSAVPEPTEPPLHNRLLVADQQMKYVIFSEL